MIQIVHGDSAARSLSGTVLVRRDLLTWGPCDADPARHRAARMRHWGITSAQAAEGHIGVEDLRAALAGASDVLVWTSDAWSDQLYFWCLLDAMERIGVPLGAIRIAHARGRPDALGAYSAEELAAVAPAPLQSFASPWVKFAARAPLAFNEALRPPPEGHISWFPRRGRLSEADTELFAAVGDAFVKRATVLSRAPRLLRWLGDTGVFARLEAWREKRAVEVRGEEVRLTAVGRKLRDQGGTLAEFAPIFIGGCRVNDPSSPWIRDGAVIKRG